MSRFTVLNRRAVSCGMDEGSQWSLVSSTYHQRFNCLPHCHVAVSQHHSDSASSAACTEKGRWFIWDNTFPVCSGFAVYERPDFSGQMLECTEDLRDLADHWHRHEVQSAQVLDGTWVFFELPNFHGRQYLLEKGEYRRFTEWAAMNPKVGSFRRVV
ncbi:hypothetical protein fugu_000805 [Takifugu bimaculatus]|uniref:Beta/gamma crystallin 'Greek key' domain-containing protein n=1 Tax=Takifugu bimaculatus TaxID=433685 RepID=A0A4Z2CHQ9_9TELE|nr:hypothetical protein fugu_000805 [Takifugu bimaculatus]